MLQLFEYSKLFFELERSSKLFNGLDEFKVACYVFPNHIDHVIHPYTSF